MKVRHMVFSKVSLRHGKSIMRGAQHTQQNKVQSRKQRWWGFALPAAILCLLAPVLSAGSAPGYGNPGIGNPIGPGTVPPSTYESPLASTPNPINTTGNRVITGNVSGGKYFRGSIPYGSTTSFGAPLGSTSLDSFLRYSAVPDELGGYSSGYSPFYSPSGTVTTMQPGYQAVFAPASPKVATSLPSLPVERPADVMALADVPQVQFPTAQTNPTFNSSIGTWQAPASSVAPRPLYSPVPRMPDEMRQVVPDEPATLSADQQLPQQGTELVMSEEYRRQLEQLQRDIEKVSANASELEQSLKTDDGAPATALEQKSAEAVTSSSPAAAPSGTIAPLPGSRSQPSTLNLPDRGLPQMPQPSDRSASPGQLPNQNIARLLNPVPLPGQEQAGVARIDGSMEPQPQIDNPLTSPQPSFSQPAAPRDRIDAIFSTQGQPGAASVSPAPELPVMQRVKETARAFDAPSDFLQRPARSVAGGETLPPNQVSTLMKPLRTAPAGKSVAPGVVRDSENKAQTESSQPLPGDRTLQKYGTGKLGSFSQEKFDHYLRAAEQYLRQGRYYRATDSFTLAAAYKPDDARPYLGRSHALFAAGEYLSSAVVLARAIDLDPRSTLGRSDLVNTVGGPDVFASRVTDLEQCAKTANAPQLQFLLAYVYFQMGRPAEAKAAIAAAEKRLPASPAIDLLKLAVGR